MRAIDLAHATRSKQGNDFVGAEARARHEGHVGMRGMLPRDNSDSSPRLSQRHRVGTRWKSELP